MISNKDGEPKEFHVENRAITRRGHRPWNLCTIYYTPEDAMEDAEAIYDAATRIRTVVAE